MTALYRNSYQRGFISILFGGGSKPLNIWETHIQSGFISRSLDPEIKALVLDVRGTNVSTTYMKCPKGNDVLGISMPFLVMIVKNLHKYFTFEVTIMDQAGFRRRFRVANFQSTTKVTSSCTAMPISLSSGWNQIQFNLEDFTYKAYKQSFSEVLSVKINANIRIRSIYFAATLVPDDQLPTEYRLFRPVSRKGYQKCIENKENEPPEAPPESRQEQDEMLIEVHKEKEPSITAVPPSSRARLSSAARRSIEHKPDETPAPVAAEEEGHKEPVEVEPGSPKEEAETQPGKAVSKTTSVTKQSRKGSRTSKSSVRASKSSQIEGVVSETLEEVPPVPATSKTSRGSKEIAGGIQEATDVGTGAPRRSTEIVEGAEVTSSATKLPEGDLRVVKKESEEPPNVAEEAITAEGVQEDKPQEDKVVSPTASMRSQQQ